MTEKEKHSFYHSAAWQRMRIKILKRDHYECQACRHRITKANEVRKRKDDEGPE